MGTASQLVQTAKDVSLSIPARPENLALCRLVLAGIGQTRPIEPEALADLKLALTEAVSNSILHAYGESGGGTVSIRYSLSESGIAIQVSDEGPGFAAEEPQPVVDDLREEGMGLAIIRALMDDVRVEQVDGGGACISFSRALP